MSKLMGRTGGTGIQCPAYGHGVTGPENEGLIRFSLTFIWIGALDVLQSKRIELYFVVTLPHRRRF
jgi:hypothetical protein